MKQSFCFRCQKYVDVFENGELSCEHATADQQTMYEFIIGVVDKILINVYTEQNVKIQADVRRRKACDITFKILGDWYSDKFKTN